MITRLNVTELDGSKWVNAEYADALEQEIAARRVAVQASRTILIEESVKGFEVYGMPDDENRLECVPKADHDEALKTLAIQSDRRKELAAALIDEKTRTGALESELKASQEVADHRLGAMTLLVRVNDWFYPPETDVPEEAALLVEVHRFLESCTCPPSVPQHLDTCRCSVSIKSDDAR